MDAFTLHVSTAIVSAMMAISLLAFYVVGHRQRSLIDWSIAGGLFFVSSCIGLLSYSLQNLRSKSGIFPLLSFS